MIDDQVLVHHPHPHCRGCLVRQPGELLRLAAGARHRRDTMALAAVEREVRESPQRVGFKYMSCERCAIPVLMEPWAQSAGKCGRCLYGNSSTMRPVAAPAYVPPDRQAGLRL